MLSLYGTKISISWDMKP